jgi:hypothetical protein
MIIVAISKNSLNCSSTVLTFKQHYITWICLFFKLCVNYMLSFKEIKRIASCQVVKFMIFTICCVNNLINSFYPFWSILLFTCASYLYVEESWTLLKFNNKTFPFAWHTSPNNIKIYKSVNFVSNSNGKLWII